MLRVFLIFGLLTSLAHAATLRGHVVDAAGAAVPDAKLWLWQEHTTKTSTSAADGAYSFEDVQTGTMQLVALKEGLALGGASRFVVGDGEEEIVLGPAGQIHLKITSPPSQSPAAGVRVFALLVSDSFVVPAEELAAHGFPQWRSGDDGGITLDNMPADGFVKINLKHVDFADTYLDFVPVRERPTPVLLEPGVVARGQVKVGVTGIANARVTVFQLGSRGQREFARATTDAEGLFRFRATPGEYFVGVRHPDWASPEPSGITLKPAVENELSELALLAPVRLHGSVVYPDGSPCQGVRVTYREKDTIYDDTFTGSDGKFSIKAASPKGTLRIGAPEGFKTEILSDIKVDLGDKRESTIEPVKLSKLPAIEGTITLEDGSPGAHVLLASLNLPQGIWMITDEQGRFFFQLAGDADEEEVVLLAEHAERFQRAEFRYALRDPKPATVKLASYSPDEQQPEIAGGTNNLSALIDQKAPELKCSKWFNAETASLETLKGKVAVMLFWAGFDTTVEGVNKVEQMRALIALYKDDPQVGFVALHDSTSEAAEVGDFVEQTGLTCPVGLDAEPLVTFGAYRVNFIPEVVLLDKRGNLRYYQPGPRIVEYIKILRRRAE